MTRPHFGRCRRGDHGNTYGAYWDDLTIGLCVFGLYVEVGR